MKFLIIGETCNDKFIYGSVERLCPEAPVPVFQPKRETNHLGMAANVMENLKAIAEKQEDTRSLFQLFSNVSSGSKTRYVDEVSNQMLMRLDDDAYLYTKNIREVKLEDYDAVIVSDYNKGLLTYSDLRYISGMCKKYKVTSFLDTKKKYDSETMRRFSFIKINYKEYLTNDFGLADKERLIVTKGSQGCEYNGKQYPCQANQVFDVSGAGDTFLASFAYNYMQDRNIEKSLDFAQKCCSIVVGKKGVCTI